MTKKILAGFAGALALNIVHELVRKNFDNVPALNEVGEEALQKGLSKINLQLENKDAAYLATLAGDVVSNSFYYAGTATNAAGLLSGALAGIGAIYLPKYIGLDDSPVASTDRKKLLTIAYYTLGGLITNIIYKQLKK